MKQNNEWESNPEYRKKVIRELEIKGIIRPLDGRTFAELVGWVK